MNKMCLIKIDIMHRTGIVLPVNLLRVVLCGSTDTDIITADNGLLALHRLETNSTRKLAYETLYWLSGKRINQQKLSTGTYVFTHAQTFYQRIGELEFYNKVMYEL